ncbi:MAG: tRNA (adenosine(37)-N6)-dimethylallyltransferase MiaA [Bacteroidales bacterium]|nr:tRNA (adenosine(37)-N6)-dimethylallyltransferase MiaA [Bacteroidales bacterium]MBN2758612.1 tRNA (adenosine(37)-N6)-dimethylallyltransferase MiaA [Bacteroidales bacterium]
MSELKSIKTLIVIVGPTGIGKTDLGICLAKSLDTEIISADSRQFYKELRIGTAVPNETQLKSVKHHFIGNKSIDDYYNASSFEFEVIDLLDKLFIQKKNIIMLGGSGMYVDAVCKGIDYLPDIDMDIRNKLIKKFENEGIESLRFELQKYDPEYYKIADLKNPKRLLKALEISIMTGKPYSSFRTKENKTRNFSLLKIGLNIEREQLYYRIDQRVDKMIENGLLDEAKQFLNNKHLNALNTVGYKELFPYFEGEYNLDRAVELIKRNTRRYAKRQLSWFNRDKEIKWFNPSERENIFEFVKNNISNM